MNHFHSIGCLSGCSHVTRTSKDRIRSLLVALVLLLGTALAQLAVGLASHSLALVAESGHMISDGLALVLSLLATWIAGFPPSEQATFGYRRIEILAALANGTGLLAVAVWIGWEAITRLQTGQTEEILSMPMLVTALVGLGINSLNARLLHQDSHHDLNLRGAFLHMIADAVSSIGVMITALVIWRFHWNWADAAVSLAVAGLIVVGAIPLIRQSLEILLEKTPAHLDLEQIATHLKRFDGVIAVSNLRVWSIALGQDVLSAHLTVSYTDGQKRDRLLQQVQISLQQEFGIAELFLQLSSGMPLALSPSLIEQIEQLDTKV